MWARAVRVASLEIPIEGGHKMTKTAVIVRADLSTEILDITENELSQLQQAVDGLIQPVDIGPVTMWVNEEGLMRNDLKANWIASGFMKEIGSGTPIMGDAVFTGGTDEDGNTLGMPEDAMSELLRVTAKAKEVLGL
jgi:hypothetical protein